MSGMPWVKLTATFAGFLGLGYVLMKAVTPTPEQLYDRMSPEIRRKVDASRAQRLAAEAAMQQQISAQTQAASGDPDSQKPVWAEQRK
ncbi:hypothetical protein PNOK_0137400 [Pyrrhoderma noxium]|uniref:Assembly factor cbp4 n=1 Tax=Pyrrhoderma noxium TaxID=2282107 RepID=A0A286UXJ4_9AGAM|nr:hypothetical protein PNOK_0137400 [Pyrrhoderma noxium]